jgi:hypothetical protein
VSGSPSASLDAVPSNVTVSGVGPLAGWAWMTAVGGLLLASYTYRRMRPLS